MPKSSRTRSTARAKTKPRKLHHKVNYHIQRHVLRYVGGGMALFLLTFSAGTGLSNAEKQTATGTNAPNGYLLVYSQKGQYEKAKIEAVGSAFDSNGYKCAGKELGKDQRSTTVSLAKNEKQFLCAAIDGDAHYKVTLLGDCHGQECEHSTTVTADVDGGHCTYIHADATKVRKTLTQEGTCPSDDDNDIIEPVEPLIRLLPAAKKNKISGTAELSIPGRSVTRDHCAGQLVVTLLDNNKKSVETLEVPLKFVSSSLEKKKGGMPAYCVTKFNFGIVKEPGTYSISAEYAGGDLFKANKIDSGTITVEP